MTAPELRTILVIDDDPSIRKVLSLGLERMGYAIKMATNGQEGIDLLASGATEPDCVLLDIRMPVLSGKDALPRIREMHPLIPVIMLTAYNDLATGLEAMKNGAFDYLVKPSRLDHIAETIAKAIRYRDIVREKFEQDKKNEEYKLSLERSMQSKTLELSETYEKLKAANMQTVQALAETIEAKDQYTQGHCERVRSLAVRLARELKLPEDQIEPLEFAALLHDIGKMGISENILNKKGRLLPHEFAQIQTHPEIGYKILAKSKGLQRIAEIVLYHHERWDGGGYPAGLREDKIPLGSRIIAVADSVDAMTTIRPYRRALSWEECWEEILINKGLQFDPVAVEASEKLWKKWQVIGKAAEKDSDEVKLKAIL